MAKKQGSASASKAAKKVKAAQKVERKETKKVLKSKSTSGANTPLKGKGKHKTKKANDSDTDDDDLEGILERMQKEWEIAHTVTEELVEGPPSRRANATLTGCPNGNHLWCIGGEFFSEDGRAYFYNDVFRYSPDKDERKKFVSPTCPGPRSAHAVIASPSGGGKLFLFGGEFSSLHQNSFHHYRDFWCFDIATHSWDRIDTKVRPSARSGHRMAVWKHYIILFGGFYDPGITTRNLNDLWIFDTQEYKWTLIEFKDTDPRPSPRSGFSFLPCADGIVLHGGYCKEYMKGKRPVGIMLEDTWLLKITLPSDVLPQSPTTLFSKSNVPIASSSKPKSSSKGASSSKFDGPIFKWEKRKRPSDAYAPCLRSGCTMALWGAKAVGILFGGVTDEDTSEEGLESMFWNDLYGYQLTGKGKWISMTLKKPKVQGGKRGGKKKQQQVVGKQNRGYDTDEDHQDGSDDDEVPSKILDLEKEPKSPSGPVAQSTAKGSVPDADDPLLTIPLPRYNAMLAVLRNTLYIYGGIYERGSREYTLDDFYALQLDKLDRYQCLKKSDVVIPEGEVESSSSEDESDEDDEATEDEADDEDGTETLVDPEEEVYPVEVSKIKTIEEVEPEEVVMDSDAQDGGNDNNDLRIQATAFMGVSKDATRSAEDVQSTPLPGETLAMFYARSREYWTQKALGNSDNKGKQLRRDGFTLAEEKYAAYKPILQEVEKILQEAGLDEEEMRRGAAGGPVPAGSVGASRNRR